MVAERHSAWCFRGGEAFVSLRLYHYSSDSIKREITKVFVDATIVLVVAFSCRGQQKRSRWSAGRFCGWLCDFPDTRWRWWRWKGRKGVWDVSAFAKEGCGMPEISPAVAVAAVREMGYYKRKILLTQDRKVPRVRETKTRSRSAGKGRKLQRWWRVVDVGIPKKGRRATEQAAKGMRQTLRLAGAFLFCVLIRRYATASGS